MEMLWSTSNGKIRISKRDLYICFASYPYTWRWFELKCTERARLNAEDHIGLAACSPKKKKKICPSNMRQTAVAEIHH